MHNTKTPRLVSLIHNAWFIKMYHKHTAKLCIQGAFLGVQSEESR